MYIRLTMKNMIRKLHSVPSLNLGHSGCLGGEALGALGLAWGLGGRNTSSSSNGA